MTRINVLMLPLVVFCAFSVVEFQHDSRTLFVARGHELKTEDQLETAYQLLTVQLAKLDKGERVVQLAKTQLKMAPATREAVVYMPLDLGDEP